MHLVMLSFYNFDFGKMHFIPIPIRAIIHVCVRLCIICVAQRVLCSVIPYVQYLQICAFAHYSYKILCVYIIRRRIRTECIYSL